MLPSHFTHKDFVTSVVYQNGTNLSKGYQQTALLLGISVEESLQWKGGET